MRRIFAAGLTSIFLMASDASAGCRSCRAPETVQEAYERKQREAEREHSWAVGISIAVGVVALALAAQFVRDSKLALAARAGREEWDG